MIVAFTSLSFVLVSSVNCTMVTIYYLCKSEPACSLNWAIVLCNNIWKNGVTLIFIQYIYYIYIYIHFRVIWVFGWFRVLHGTLHWPLLWLLVGELDRIPQWGDTCWANYWYIYTILPLTYFTLNQTTALEQCWVHWGWALCPTRRVPVIVSPVIPSKRWMSHR